MERQRAFFSPLTLRSRSLGFVRPPADGYLLDVRQIIVCADAASAAKVVIVVRHPDGRADNVRMKPDLALLAGVHAHLEHIAARLANALAQRHYERPRLAAAALHDGALAISLESDALETVARQRTGRVVKRFNSGYTI